MTSSNPGATASWPLLNRGPEALQHLLAGNEVQADENLRLLTRSELIALAEHAERLAVRARELETVEWRSWRKGFDHA